MELEKMGDFFDSRLDIYDEHQLNCIDYAKEFYPLTASLLPKKANTQILDLGCGTGLELEYYFKLNPTATVTGIDLAKKMLETLKNKFNDKNITLINQSYFETALGENKFDATVSVESLHHFAKEEKTELYKKIQKSLKDGGYFLLTDYFSKDDKEEKLNFKELERLKKEQSITDNSFYHKDTPLTVEHEITALENGGFSKVEIIKSWKVTSIIKAYK